MTVILGLNAYHGDASACIVRDGEVLVAIEEERLTRVKHTGGFPVQAIRACLALSGIHPEEIDHVVIPRKRSAHILSKALWAVRLPHLAFKRGRVWRKFGAIEDMLAHSLDIPRTQMKAQFHFVEHHVAHAASSFYASPFEDAAILSLDGLGDFASTLWGSGKDLDMNIDGFVLFPHSLGIYYTAITQYLGFWKYGDEYKVMGLASYGEPIYKNIFDHLVRSGSSLDFSLGLKYFMHHRTDADMSWDTGEPKLSRLFSDDLEKALGPSRKSGAPIEKHHEDIASTLQWKLEESVFTLLNQLYQKTQIPRLVYAGGVAFNCVANGKIFDRTPFTDVYIQPAAGDAGLAVGGALYVSHQILRNTRTMTGMPHAYWGPEYTAEKLKSVVDHYGLSYQYLDLPKLIEKTVQHLANKKVVGWYQGRMEWGPRALGNRSILVDPRHPEMKDLLNKRIKHREPFRPFSPSILEEKTGQWFEKEYPSPFMLLAYPVRPEKRDKIPAPTHVDGTGRLQTVSREANPLYWELINSFEKETGVPVILNTSFNENEPVVNRPEEAIECFLRTKMDVLVLGSFLIEKDEKPLRQGN